jgi:predicted ATPase
MTFDEVLGQVLELLRREKRVSYRGLQRRFSLDEAYLADLKEELLFAHPEIADVDGRGLTRFVGRQSELEQLQKALEQAKAGQGQIVGVTGEPGLGKSRLFYEFKLLCASGCLVLEAYSVSHGKATAYLPVIELLKSYFDIKSEDNERKRREKVAGKVVILDLTLEEILPYLYALLGIEEQPSPLQQMDAQIRRRRTFEALKKLFLRESLNTTTDSDL